VNRVLTAGRPGGGAATGLVTAGLATSVCIAAGAALFPLLTIALAVAAALVTVTVANLTYGVAIFTMVTFFERLPGVEGLALSRPMGFVLVISWLATLARGTRDIPLLPRDRPALAYVLVLLVGWGAISALWAADSATAISSAIRLALVVVLFFVVFTALRTPRDLMIVTWTFLAGAFLVSVVSLATGANKAGRLAAGELDPNFLAASLAAAIAVALFLLWGTSHSTTRFVLLVFMGTYAVSIVLTESRSGLVAAACAAIAAALFGGPVRARVVATVLVIAALGVGYYAVLAPSALRERVETTAGSDAREPRLDSWNIALQISEDNPVLGVGLGNFRVVEPSYLNDQINLLTARKLHQINLVAHNTYLELLSELGIVGLTLFASAAAMTLLPAVRGVRRLGLRASQAALTTRGLVVGVVALLAAYFFLSGFYAKQLWLLFGVLAAIPTVAATITRERAG